MIWEMSYQFLLMALVGPLLLLVMLLPTFVELRRPRDAGPRFVSSGVPPVKFTLCNKAGQSQLLDIDFRYELDFLLLPLVENAVNFLPNLDA
jgi:hypothetical protein